MVVQGKRKKKTAKKSVPKSTTASTVSPVRRDAVNAEYTAHSMYVYT